MSLCPSLLKKGSYILGPTHEGVQRKTGDLVLHPVALFSQLWFSTTSAYRITGELPTRPMPTCILTNYIRAPKWVTNIICFCLFILFSSCSGNSNVWPTLATTALDGTSQSLIDSVKMQILVQ